MKQMFGDQDKLQPKSYYPPPLCDEFAPDIIPNKT